MHNSAHPAHCSKAIPYGVATRVRRNCSPEAFEKRSKEYQDYLINWSYNPRKVQQQFNKVTSIPRENLLTPKIREKHVLFPLVTDFNPRLPNISKIISSHTRLIYSSLSLAKIFPKVSIIPSFRRTKNIKEILAGSYTTSETALNKVVLNARANVILESWNFLKETDFHKRLNQ